MVYSIYILSQHLESFDLTGMHRFIQTVYHLVPVFLYKFFFRKRLSIEIFVGFFHQRKYQLPI